MKVILDQNKAIKAKYPGALLLFLVGDCYEAFGEDAKLVSHLTGVTLSTSSNSAEKVMASFPFRSLDSHLRTLVKAGYKVAICEQLEDPGERKGPLKKR